MYNPSNLVVEKHATDLPESETEERYSTILRGIPKKYISMIYEYIHDCQEKIILIFLPFCFVACACLGHKN